ncbi:unnamed protein product, partial [Effrenium voratum]
RTGYCDGTSTCAPHPSVTFSEVTGNWSSCDKVCGGGQQIRDRVCLGSDGLKYPTYLCPGLSSATDVQSCNTIACDLPLVPDNYTFGMDKDLRPEWLDITVLATLPTKATALQLRLGSSSGSMLDMVAEVLSNECLNNLCTLQGQVKAPAYADRLLLMGKNSDGLGPAVSEAFTDRVGETGSFQKFTVQSEAGMVHFSVAGASAASGTWAPADRLPGIRMHLPDARRLMRTVGPRFGNPESTEHGVVVIDTVAVPGIPATRWVYATRPVFLSMDPSILTFLSAGILKPEIQNFRVAYLDLSCSTDFVSGIPENPTSEDFQRSDLRLRLASMYDQMQKSLRSDGWATNQRLRGELVLLDPAHGVKPHASKYWEFYTGANGDTLMKLRDVHALDQLQDAATGLSLACGAMASLLFTFVFFKLARKGIRARNMEKRAQNTLLRQKLGEIKDKEQNHLDQQIQAAEGNPFLQPLLLIDLLVMEPILSKLLNSLSRFSSEFLVVSHAEQFKRPAQVVPAEPEAFRRILKSPVWLRLGHVMGGDTKVRKLEESKEGRGCDWLHPTDETARGRCWDCGSTEHMRKDCPRKVSKPGGGERTTAPAVKPFKAEEARGVAETQSVADQENDKDKKKKEVVVEETVTMRDECPYVDRAVAMKLLDELEELKTEKDKGEVLVQALIEKESIQQLWKAMKEKEGLSEITFFQSVFGGKAAKPTTMGTDLELAIPEESQSQSSKERRSTRTTRAAADVEGLKELARWAPGLMRSVAKALLEATGIKTAVRKLSWAERLANGHTPYRRDCRVCQEASAQGRAHRRIAHPQAHILSVDLAGPLRRGHDIDGKSCRYFLMGAYTLPRGGKEEVWDEEIDGLAPGSWKVPQRVQAMRRWKRIDENAVSYRTTRKGGPPWRSVKWRVTVDNDTGEVLESVEATNLEEEDLHRLLGKTRNLRTILFYEKGTKGQEGEIYWTKSIDGRMVIRVHKSHRKGKFFPEEAEECPVPIDQLADVRRTVARKAKAGAYETVTDDWRTAGAGERLFEDDSRWAGRTIFMIKGAPDPPPRPELVIEEEEYEPELPPLEAGD